jgi:2-keto-3-deoxy-L-rhamnonate aldolase RhmA
VIVRQRNIPAGLKRPGECAFGTWVKFPSMEAVELLGRAGFDYVVVDMEHSPLTLETAYGLIFTAQACGMAALVRVPDRSGSHVQRVLDAGADGILVPQVSSVEQATTCVRQMIFSPRGVRGTGGTSRAGGWGLDGAASYVADGDEIVRGIQIEDLASLRAGAEYLAIDGLGAVFVGLGDLTLSSGLPADAPEIEEAITGLLDAATQRGIPCGTAVGTVAAATRAAERGFSFVMVSNDTTIFGQAATRIGTELGLAPG